MVICLRPYSSYVAEARRRGQAAQLQSLACSLHDTHGKQDQTRAEAVSEIMPGLKGPAVLHNLISTGTRDLPIFQEKSEIQIFLESFWVLNGFAFVLTLCSPNKVPGQTACGPGRLATCHPSSQGSCLPEPCCLLLAQRPWGVLSLAARRGVNSANNSSRQAY